MQSHGSTDGDRGCAQARPLVAPYLDGELSEALAGPLRRHLMDCPACRAEAQAGRSLKRWFAAEPAMAVPGGFAARVARRAFAGDTGERGAESDEGWAPVAAAEQGALLGFVLRLTAAAALLLIGLSVSSRLQQLPPGDRLRAQEPTRSTEEILRRLDELDRKADKDPSAPARTEAAKPK